MLPDLDESVSFVVDKGSPVGPIPMRSIIDSIRSGERAPDVLVWWAGATDWIGFSNEPALLDLLQALPANNQPPPPPAGPEATELDEADLDEAEPEDAETEQTPVEPAHVQNTFPEPEVRTFDVSSGDDESFVGSAVAAGTSDVNQPVDLEDAASELDEAELELQKAESELDDVLEHYPVQLDDDSIGHHIEASTDPPEPDQPFSDQEAEAEADALLARDPRSMHPSATWGDDDQGNLETRAIDTDAFERKLAEQGSLETSAIDRSVLDEMVSDDVAPDAETPADRLTGLFGSVRRDAGDRAHVDAVAVGEDEATPSSLENVGARIEALTSATRRLQQGGAVVIDESYLIGSEIAAEQTVSLAAHTDLASPGLDEVERAEATGDVKPKTEAEVADGEVETAAATDPSTVPSSGSWQAVEDVPQLEDRFSEMVRLSVAHQRRIDWALRPDELLLSSCITTIVERGFVLLDVEHHDASQLAIFDHHDDSRHVRLELSPLSPVNAAGDPVGPHVQVSVSWGREVQDADAAFATVRANATDELVDPGTISCEANMVASSATTSVDLIWAAHEFVRDDHSVDRTALDASVISIVHALEARWHELFVAAD